VAEATRRQEDPSVVSTMTGAAASDAPVSPVVSSSVTRYCPSGLNRTGPVPFDPVKSSVPSVRVRTAAWESSLADQARRPGRQSTTYGACLIPLGPAFA